MKFDNYFYINSEKNYYLENHNNIEHFNLNIYEGPQGNRGKRGYMGQIGSQGLQGDRGEKGNDGERGEQGPQGYRGLSGPIGIVGDSGRDGLKGKVGLRGYVGPRGDFGPRGPPGPKGDIGEKGLKGPDGFKGKTGAPGTQGSAGGKLPKITGKEGREFNFGVSPFIMDGFSSNNQTVYGNMENPYTQFSIPYQYSFNVNKKSICPPNSYLKAFAFRRNGKERTLPKWCPSSGETSDGNGPNCYSGTGKGDPQYASNYWRPGMPMTYQTECVKLI